MLRRLACLALLSASAACAGAEPAAPAPDTAGVPPLLLAALAKMAHDFDRWAFTETSRLTDEHGVPQPATVVRFDPSRPYAEQYQPLKVKGKPPTERQLKDYRRKGEKRGEMLAQQVAEGQTPGSAPPQLKLNGATASVDLARATVAAETADSVTYEVPLRNDGHGTLPVEKFQLFARVNRATGDFENVALRVRSAFRMKLILKVKSGEASVDFARVAPEHNPVPVTLTGDASASVLFVTFGGGFDVKRTDFKRVTPYSERFGVKIGPLKAMDF